MRKLESIETLERSTTNSALVFRTPISIKSKMTHRA